MARRGSTEEILSGLRQLGKVPITPEAIEELRKNLSGSNHILAAEAARIAGNHTITDLIPDLLTAFARFMENPTKTDKGCLAKEAIAEALDELYCDDGDVFIRGIRHVQQEPAYGGPVDVAAILRGRCAFALARIGRRDSLFELAELLMDPEPQARIGAIKALVHMSRDESELLLRMKVLAGDEEIAVTGECLSGLMTANPERSIGFVERFLTSDDPVLSEDAAFALGGSRHERAFESLRNHRENSVDPAVQDMLLLPIAMTRREEAFDFLIDVIENDHRDSAAASVEALAKMLGSDDRYRRRIHEAVISRDEVKISEAYAIGFDRTDNDG